MFKVISYWKGRRYVTTYQTKEEALASYHEITKLGMQATITSSNSSNVIVKLEQVENTIMNIYYSVCNSVVSARIEINKCSVLLLNKIKLLINNKVRKLEKSIYKSR